MRIFILLIVFLLIRVQCFGLDCEPWSIDQYFDEAEFVLVGTVVAKEQEVSDFGYPTTFYQRIDLQVDRLFKGDTEQRVVTAFMYGGDQYFQFPPVEVGSSWIMFLETGSNDWWPDVTYIVMTGCGPSSPLVYEGSALVNLLRDYAGEEDSLHWRQLERVNSRYAFSPVFGLVYTALEPWVANETLGWLWISGQSSEEAEWVYSAVNGWIWLSWNESKWVYRASDGAWIYYRGPESQNSVWVYNDSTGSFESEAPGVDLWALDPPFVD